MKSLFKFLLFVLILSVAVAGLYNLKQSRPGGGSGGTKFQLASKSSASAPEKYTPADGPKLDPSQVDVLAAIDDQYRKLVKAVVPSVVSISTSRTVNVRVADPLEQLFYGPGARGRNLQQKQNALGSGVIVSKEGHILTNHHVVNTMDEITVQLSDGREFPARVIGSDSASDIAVLKIDAEDVSALPLGDSDDVQAGQLVFAIGNPFGFDESVTQGIVSAVGRRTTNESANEYIQTDTAINPGNSGGPLVNLRGEIVGINNHIWSRSGGSQGIGFAIPSNVARRAMDSLLRTGRIQRSYLGVSLQPLDPALAERLGTKDLSGALVASVMEDSPAAAAGLRSGDIIRTINGRKLKSSADLVSAVSSIEVGGKANLELTRAGKSETVTATVGEYPTDGGMAAIPGAPPSAHSGPVRGLPGIEVRELDQRSAQQLRLDPGVRGVVVVQVNPQSPAASVLQPGDVIQEIDRRPVTGLKDYSELMANLDLTQPVMLFISRNGARSFVVLAP